MANNNDIDMFSKLPNDLIFMIIFYLPFKEAARTSILSTQWRHIWLTTKIEFFESFFVREDENEEMKELNRSRFVDFVCRWIENYNETTVNTFRLVFSRPVNFVTDVQNFISFSIAHNVKELALDFHDPMWPEYDLENHEVVFDLPMNVYGHKGLEHLELFSCNMVASQFNYTEGTLFRLDSIKYPIYQGIVGALSIVGEFEFEEIQHWYEIVAPNLTFWKYSGTEGLFRIETQDSLAEVELDFGLQLDFGEATGVFLYEHVRQLVIVKVLTVCGFLLQVIPHAREPFGMTVLLNVDHLILNAAMHPDEYFGINFMLRSCPLLQTLTINIGPGGNFLDYTPPVVLNPGNCWIGYVVVYPCITTSLKVVNMKGFKGTMFEACLLNHLISFGNVVQELNLYLSDEVDANGANRETYRLLVQRVQQFRAASVNLRKSIN